MAANVDTSDGRKWSSKSIGSRFQHRIFYFIIRIGGKLPAYVLLRCVVFYYMMFRPSIRKRTYHYLYRRFPGENSLRMWMHGYRLSLELGKVLVDRAVIGILGPRTMIVDFDGKERMRDLVNEGKGVILITAHVGTWQTALAALNQLDVQVNMLVHREPGDVDQQYFEHAEMPAPYRVIDPAGYLGGTLEMMEVLGRGEILCMMGDRLFGSSKHALRVPFLGEEAFFPISAYRIASAMGSPIAVLLSNRAGPCRIELKLGAVIWVPIGLGRKNWEYNAYLASYVDLLESYAMEYPYQFFNFYDMWSR